MSARAPRDGYHGGGVGQLARQSAVPNRLEERLKLPSQPKLLIIDEIGYIPIDRQGANLFFSLSVGATNVARSC